MLCAAALGLAVWHRPERANRRLFEQGRRGLLARPSFARDARGLRRAPPRRKPRLQAIVEPEGARHRPRAVHRLARTVGHEGGNRLLEAGLAGRMREEMHGRIPAARASNQVALDLARRPGHPIARGIQRPDGDARELFCASDRNESAGGNDLDARGAGRRRRFAGLRA